MIVGKLIKIVKNLGRIAKALVTFWYVLGNAYIAMTGDIDDLIWCFDVQALSYSKFIKYINVQDPVSPSRPWEATVSSISDSQAALFGNWLRRMLLKALSSYGGFVSTGCSEWIFTSTFPSFNQPCIPCNKDQEIFPSLAVAFAVDQTQLWMVEG